MNQIATWLSRLETILLSAKCEVESMTAFIHKLQGVDRVQATANGAVEARQGKQHYPEAGMHFWDISSLVGQHGPNELPVISWKLLAQLIQIIICMRLRTVGQHFAGKQGMTNLRAE